MKKSMGKWNIASRKAPLGRVSARVFSSDETLASYVYSIIATYEKKWNGETIFIEQLRRAAPYIYICFRLSQGTGLSGSENLMLTVLQHLFGLPTKPGDDPKLGGNSI